MPVDRYHGHERPLSLVERRVVNEREAGEGGVSEEDNERAREGGRKTEREREKRD